MTVVLDASTVPITKDMRKRFVIEFSSLKAFGENRPHEVDAPSSTPFEWVPNARYCALSKWNMTRAVYFTTNKHRAEQLS